MAHYPHTENEYRLADKLGLMVWSEIPVYWGIDWTNPHTLDVAKHQLWEMIRRDHNHASVILWSMSNETPESPERNAFIHQLAVEARSEDPTRLITSAIVTHFKGTTATLDDPLGQDLDVLGYNEYLGWYQGTAATIPDYTWQNPMGKPVIMSEFGAGAKAGLHGPATDMFTEEYQDNVYRQQFQMLGEDAVPARHDALGPDGFSFARCASSPASRTTTTAKASSPTKAKRRRHSSPCRTTTRRCNADSRKNYRPPQSKTTVLFP